MDKTFPEPEQAEDVPVKNEKIMDDTSNKEVEFDPDDMEAYDMRRMQNMDERLDDVYQVACEARRPSPPRLEHGVGCAAGRPSPPQLYSEWCTFVNDTKYTVMITDKDGTRPLKPGKSTTNLGIPGFKVILVLKLPNKDAQIEFPLSGFNNSTQKISQIYENEINQN